MTWLLIALAWLALSCVAAVVVAALGRAGSREDDRRAAAVQLPAPRPEQPLTDRERQRS